ncbi:MAG: hypothetical protein IKK03_09780 [Lachnospiraceae bacterium]|nr:hypothetical protein [Lachnospiraceae bacterium]
MLIKQIIDGDIAGCRHAVEADAPLKELEEELYSIMSKCPEEITFDMESTINAYIARVMRIAYLQGIKDFANLYITLQEDVHNILKKCE